MRRETAAWLILSRILLPLALTAVTPRLGAQQVDYNAQIQELPGYLLDNPKTPFATLYAACSAAVSAGKVLALTRAWTVTSSSVCGARIYGFLGGVITASNATVTLSGTFDGDLSRHFALAGSGTFAVAAPFAMTRYLPQWWGNIGSGTLDDSAVFQAAFNQASNFHQIVMTVPTGKYLISKTVTPPSYPAGRVSMQCLGGTDQLPGADFVAGENSFTMFHFFGGYEDAVGCNFSVGTHTGVIVINLDNCTQCHIERNNFYSSDPGATSVALYGGCDLNLHVNYNIFSFSGMAMDIQFKYGTGYPNCGYYGTNVSEFSNNAISASGTRIGGQYEWHNNDVEERVSASSSGGTGAAVCFCDQTGANSYVAMTGDNYFELQGYNGTGKYAVGVGGGIGVSGESQWLGPPPLIGIGFLDNSGTRTNSNDYGNTIQGIAFANFAYGIDLTGFSAGFPGSGYPDLRIQGNVFVTGTIPIKGVSNFFNRQVLNAEYVNTPPVFPTGGMELPPLGFVELGHSLKSAVLVMPQAFGQVTADGTRAVAWSAFSQFDTAWTGTINIGGTNYTIAAVNSATSMTLTAAVPSGKSINFNYSGVRIGQIPVCGGDEFLLGNNSRVTTTYNGIAGSGCSIYPDGSVWAVQSLCGTCTILQNANSHGGTGFYLGVNRDLTLPPGYTLLFTIYNDGSIHEVGCTSAQVPFSISATEGGAALHTNGVCHQIIVTDARTNTYGAVVSTGGGSNTVMLNLNPTTGQFKVMGQ